jgi:hypothetical protein
MHTPVFHLPEPDGGANSNRDGLATGVNAASNWRTERNRKCLTE